MVGCGRSNTTDILNEHIKAGEVEQAREIIDSGINLNKTNDNFAGKLFSIFTQGQSNFFTPLYTACKEGNTEIIIYLLENGANPNITGYHQNYPLEVYYENNRYVDDSVLDAMLKANVDVNLGTSMTPIVALLRQYKDSDSETRRGLERQLIVLLENGASWEDWSEGLSEINATPIHFAIGYEEPEFVAALLSNPVTARYLNIQDGEGCTPLIIAAKNQQLECYNILIGAGADVTITDKDGKTAQHYLQAVF